jgi:hypothetical protein
MCLRAGLALSLLWLAPVGARAQPQSRPQRRCIVALNRAGAKLAAVAGQEFVRCVKAAGAGRLAAGETVAQCASPETNHRLARARAAVGRAAARHCLTPPDFGPSSAALVSDVFAALLHAEAIFGPDVGAALIDARADRAGAACQTVSAHSLARIADARLREFNRCKAAGLKKRRILSGADLEACHEGDMKGRIARAIAAAQRRATRRCAGTPVAKAFPGECARVPLAGLLDCLARRVACDVCLALDAADRIGRSCQRFVNGVAHPYCGARPATAQSVARQWDEELLQAIRLDTPRPTVHARNLFHTSVAMYDAWAAYDPTAAGYLVREKRASDNVAADRATAISFAAYRVLSVRFAHSVGAAASLPAFDARMAALGYDPGFTSTEGSSPAALGNRIGAAVLAYGLADGADEAADYKDPTYEPVNPPLIVKLPGNPDILDPNRWQPLALDLIVTQNGIPQPDKVQTFIGSQWLNVAPFALTRTDPNDVYIDPGPPPRIEDADGRYKSHNLKLLRFSGWLTPDDPTVFDVSPAVHGNNPLGTDGRPVEPVGGGDGYGLNPVTGAPYAPNLVKRGDWARVVSEFWADGPRSETPPGHWNVIANYVSDHPLVQKRIAGAGPVVDDLEWDVKLYVALNGAVHDAAIACWGLKRKYDSVRPISAIRYMAERGQSSDSMLPSYDPNGLLLEPGVAELITDMSSMAGERHAHLRDYIGEVAVLAWPGEPADPATQHSGVRWIRAKEWVPFQKKTFVTPAFASYNSGHSTYSRASAEVLTRYTGSAYFPGGLGQVLAEKNQFLKNELGPSETVVLQWASYYDAADEAGISRRFGGIHIDADDYTARTIGHQVGIDAYELAARYFAGTIVR